MSEANVEAIRRANAAFNKGDAIATFADYHPDVEWFDLGNAPDTPQRVQGVAAVRQILEQWNAAFDEFTAEIEEYVDAGDYVVCTTHWRAKGKESAVVVDLHTAEVFEFEDGKVVRATLGYADKAAALAALEARATPR